MEQIAELFKKFADIIEGVQVVCKNLQDVSKYHSKMVLDLYERITALENEVAELKRAKQ